MDRDSGDEEDRYDLSHLPLKATKRQTGRRPGVKERKQRKRHIPTCTEIGEPQPSTSVIQSDEPVEPAASAYVCEDDDGMQVPLLTQHERYKWLLHEHHGMHILNNTLTAFTLADLDLALGELKKTKYVIVTRRAIQFCGDTTHWLYGCGCDVERSRIIDTLDDVCMHNTLAGIEQTLPEACMHVHVLASLMEAVDAIDNITPRILPASDLSTSRHDDDGVETYDPDMALINEEAGPHSQAARDGLNIHQLTGRDTDPTSQCVAGTATLWAVSDSDSDSYGVVEDRASVDVQRCLTCPPSHATFCVHVTEYRRVYVAGRVNIASQQTSRPAPSAPHQSLCRSTLAIPYESTPAMHTVYTLTDDERFGKERAFSPSIELCECGSALDLQPPKTVPLYLHNKVLLCTVMSSVCTDCQRTYHYDGLDRCIMNMGHFLIDHELLRRYTYQFFYGRSTIFTEYSVLRRLYLDSNNASAMRYRDYKDAWYSFVELLDMDYASSYMCPHCGPSPETIVIDATCMAFKKSQLKKHAAATVNDQSQPYEERCSQSEMVKGRTLLDNDCRKLLMAYIQPRNGITTAARDQLLALLTARVDPAVTALLTYIISLSVTLHDRVYVNPIWRDFVSALASTNPLCGFFPPCYLFFDILTANLSVDIFQKPETLVYLQKVVPILFNLISRLRADFPFNMFAACIPEFSIKTNFPFIKPRCPSEPPSTSPSTCDDLSYFPNLPILRTRGVYIADKKSAPNNTECNKLLKDRGTLLPGVFTMYCVHGICYGFQVMERHESPNVPYTIMRTRFQTPPTIVIYDNACKLHAYALNRDAQLFKNTAFLVDRLHFKNHTACGAAYALDQYPSLSTINSQVVEQANSRLQKTKSSLSFMTQDNFMKCAKLFMFGQNMDVLSRMSTSTT